MKDFLLSATDRDPDYQAAVNAVDLTGEDADTFFDALGSETSRAIFELLYEEPRTPTELAEAIDSSRQNVHYHLRKLEAADLVHAVDTVYSSRGTEIDVYAPTSEAVVLLTGQESTVDRIREVLSRFVGGLVVLLLATLLLQAAVTGGLDVDLGVGGGAPADGGAGGDDQAAGGGSTLATPGGTPTPGMAAPPRASDGAASGASGESTPSGTVGPSGERADVLDDQTYATRRNATDGANDTVVVTSGTATPSPSPTGGPTSALSPALFFLAGGVVALTVSALWQFRRP
jgi:DNA-binding transcriptional ArsR family regulator